MGILKRFFLFVCTFLILIVAALFLIPLFIDSGTLKKILTEVASRSNIDLTIDGETSLRVIPKVRIHTTNVRFSCPDGLHGTLSDLDAVLSLWPALFGGNAALSGLDAKNINVSIPLKKDFLPEWMQQHPKDVLSITATMLHIDGTASTLQKSTKASSHKNSTYFVSEANIAANGTNIRINNILIDQADASFSYTNDTGKLLLKSMQAFGGTIEGDIGFITDKPNTPYNIALHAKDIDVQKLPRFHPVVNNIEGHISLDGGLAFARINGTDIDLHSLQGTGSVALNNGTIRGISLLDVAQNFKNVLSLGTAANNETPYSSFSASYILKDGVLENHDLKLTGTAIECTGEGSVNFPTKAVNYRLVPTLPQGSILAVKNIPLVPVLVKGTTDKLLFIPDVGTLMPNVKDTLNQVLQPGMDPKKAARSLTDSFKKDIDALKHNF